MTASPSVPSTQPTNETTASQARILRVAVIGCGAIAQQMHLPVLAGHEGVELAVLVDRDLKRAGELAAGYGVPAVLADAAELNADLMDAAIVATPPFHHASCSIDLMRRGIHVLVEKPMATTYADAVAMAEAADATGTVLSVGVFRRLYPSVRALAAAVRSEILGRPLRFDFEGGGVYNWAATTLGNLKKEWAGGGVLMDMGPHYLDLLLAVFDGPGQVLQYRDNSLGGVETDCVAELQLKHRGQGVTGRLECSRTRQLRGTLQIECERGVLELPFSERFRVRMLPHDRQAVDAATGQTRELEQWLGWRGEPECDWYESFRAGIDDWLSAIQRGTTPQLSGRSALETMRLIDECYRRREPMEEPWSRSQESGVRSQESGVRGQEAAGRSQESGVGGQESEDGTRDSSLATSNYQLATTIPPLSPAPRPRVLVTGATGFIGCRVAEILCLRDGWDVRAMVHNPANAARLARLPVEMVQADLQSSEDVARLVDGCDAVVHCAIGTAYGNRREIFAVTVDGTRRLAEAALAAGVRRLVHISTMGVYDPAAQGVLDESTPVQPRRGDEYGESKQQAEAAVLRAVRRGLSAVILRPARVFGPFGKTFVVNPLAAMQQGRFAWLGDPDVPCDMVYVDNVAEAIGCALRAADEAVRGEAFNVSDGENATWREFYRYFAAALGLDLDGVPVRPRRDSRAGGAWRGLIGWPGSCWRGVKSVVTSPEFKRLGRKVLDTDPLGTVPRWALGRYPSLERGVRRLIRADGSLPVYRIEATAAQPGVVTMGSSGAVLSIDNARQVLGYHPSISRGHGLQLTLEWVRYARLVAGRESPAVR